MTTLRSTASPKCQSGQYFIMWILEETEGLKRSNASNEYPHTKGFWGTNAAAKVGHGKKRTKHLHAAVKNIEVSHCKRRAKTKFGPNGLPNLRKIAQQECLQRNWKVPSPEASHNGLHNLKAATLIQPHTDHNNLRKYHSCFDENSLSQTSANAAKTKTQ